jgi:hypothetical protein
MDSSPLLPIFLFLAVLGFIGMMVLRSLMLWYWKVNDRLRTLQRIEQQLGDLVELQREFITIQRKQSTTITSSIDKQGVYP